jgi:uncharacterized membrane protein YraQ (UPF0718 family)
MLILIIVTLIALIVSSIKDYGKTVAGVRKGIKMFINILPALLNILILVSVFLYLVPGETLVRWLGKGSGFMGMSIAAVLGSVSLIPGFIAYPLAAILLKSGVGYNVIAIFITTLMMVGVLTLPLEAKYFGMKVALMRNALSFIGAIIIGLLIGLVL